MAIPELLHESDELQLSWTTNIFSKKDERGALNYFINCYFYPIKPTLNKEEQKRKTIYQIRAEYIPYLIPGTIWKNGKCISHFNKKYTLTFYPVNTKYNTLQLREKLNLTSLFFKNESNKSFYYIPKEDFEVFHNEQLVESFEGLIIPRSAIANYYFINSDNILQDLLTPGTINIPFDREESLRLSKEHTVKCIKISNTTPLHDAAIWLRIVHDENFNNCYKKIKNDYFFQTHEKKKYSDAHLESDFPFKSHHTITIYGRKFNDLYLLVDYIVDHENEWYDFSNFHIAQERRGQIDENTPFSELENKGHNHIVNYTLEEECTSSDNKGHNDLMKAVKEHVKFNARENIIPKGNLLKKKNQTWYTTTSYENAGPINEITVNSNSDSTLNIPKKDILASETKKIDNHQNGPNCIEKIDLVKSYLEKYHKCICEYITPFNDPHNDHPEHVTVFPPMHEIGTITNFERYKWMSRRRVPKYEPIKNRKPSFGYGVKLRGAVILKIKVEKGIFYVLEIEPGSDLIQRQFKTYFLCINQFQEMNNFQVKKLLELIAETNGVYDDKVYEKSDYEIRTRKISPDASIEEYANEVWSWIDSIR